VTPRRFPLALGVVLLSSGGCVPGTMRSSGPLTPGPNAPVVTAGSLVGQPLVQETAARAIAAGAGPLSIVATGEAAERERLGAFVDIPAGECLLGYARASRTVEDLDLAAFSEEGTPAAVDDAPDPTPTLLMCPPHPGRVYLAAVAAAGEGLVVIGAHLVPISRAPVVGKLMNAHGTRAASSRAAEAWPGLDDHIRKHHDALGGKWEVIRKVAVAVDARMPASVAFPLDSDGCTDALVVPDDDVGILEVEALDDGGRVIARGGSGAGDRALTVCSRRGSSGSLVVRPHVGQGLAAVVLARANGDVARDLDVRPELAWDAADAPLDRALARVEAALGGAGYAASQGSTAGSLPTGSTRSVPVAIGPQSACERIDVVGGAPTALVQATAWDESGKRLASAEGSSSATLFTCKREKVRLDLEALARPGPYAAVWRKEPWSDPAFMAHPVAAARMLTRMAAGGVAVLPGSPSGARAFRAEAGQEVSWSDVVPGGECLRLVAGAEGAGAGLVGRVIDAATGEEIDRAHAREAVAMRACAREGKPLPVVVSVVATAGALDVVVGERVVR